MCIKKYIKKYKKTGSRANWIIAVIRTVVATYTMYYYVRRRRDYILNNIPKKREYKIL